MSRQSITIESAQKPEGNLQLLANELEQVFELATARETRPKGLTLGVVFVELSACMGSFADIVRKVWAKEEPDVQVFVKVLRLMMVYCLVTIEALTNDPETT